LTGEKSSDQWQDITIAYSANTTVNRRNGKAPQGSSGGEKKRRSKFPLGEGTRTPKKAKDRSRAGLEEF
jgi:hypothetical protein